MSLTCCVQVFVTICFKKKHTLCPFCSQYHAFLTQPCMLPCNVCTNTDVVFLHIYHTFAMHGMTIKNYWNRYWRKKIEWLVGHDRNVCVPTGWSQGAMDGFNQEHATHFSEHHPDDKQLRNIRRIAAAAILIKWLKIRPSFIANVHGKWQNFIVVLYTNVRI